MEIARRSPRHFLGQSHDQCRPQPPEHQQHMTGRTRTPAGWAAEKRPAEIREKSRCGLEVDIELWCGWKEGQRYPQEAQKTWQTPEGAQR
ncbi:hypothetical protein DdX_09906 [Ditylenchus destructor]|uniref:Uncharacterized protein n=1 Tax=Ditylenchus destructor TaxID=166010 RepID=A0AAD4R2Q1_9BILA|nr:hypothetical protein DdX_09906 [Ditylenchus destructor]